MKILITGSKGFIGHYLLKLLSQEYEVFGVDEESDLTIEGLTEVNKYVHSL